MVQQHGDNPAPQTGDGVVRVGDMFGQGGSWNADAAFDAAVLFGGRQEGDRELGGFGEMKMEEDGLFDF